MSEETLHQKLKSLRNLQIFCSITLVLSITACILPHTWNISLNIAVVVALLSLAVLHWEHVKRHWTFDQYKADAQKRYKKAVFDNNSMLDALNAVLLRYSGKDIPVNEMSYIIRYLDRMNMDACTSTTFAVVDMRRLVDPLEDMARKKYNKGLTPEEAQLIRDIIPNFAVWYALEAQSKLINVL